MQTSRPPLYFGVGGKIRAEYEEWKVMVRLKGRAGAYHAREGLTQTVRGRGKQAF